MKEVFRGEDFIGEDSIIVLGDGYHLSYPFHRYTLVRICELLLRRFNQDVTDNLFRVYYGKLDKSCIN